VCWGCAQGGRLGVGALTNLALGKKDFQNMYSKFPFIFQHIRNGLLCWGVRMVADLEWALLRTWPLARSISNMCTQKYQYVYSKVPICVLKISIYIPKYMRWAIKNGHDLLMCVGIIHKCV